MAESPTASVSTSSEQTIRTAAIQEKLKWYRLLFTIMLGGAVWIGLQVARENEDLLNNFTSILSIGFDGLSAALIALVLLLMLLLCIMIAIYANIGKLGDPVFSQAARVQSISSTIIILIGIPLFACAPAIAVDIVLSGYHIVGIVFVVLLCVIGDVLLDRANRKNKFET